MIEINVDSDPEWDSRGGHWGHFAERVALAAVAQSDYPHLAEWKRPVEISLRLGNNEEVRALNNEWRGKDKPTNVLSFPMVDSEQLKDADAHEGPALLLGDMILAYEICRDEAEEKGVGFIDHAAHLIAHGVLHLLGYDHLNDSDAEDMEAREIRALETLGISDPYSLSAEAH